MESYNLFCILINFHLMLYLLVDYEIVLTAGHCCVFFNFLLANFINCGTRLIHAQVTIFISSMSCYIGSINIDVNGDHKIYYPIAFDRLLFKIRELEKEHIKVVSKMDLETKNLVKGEYELFLKKYKVLVRQENHDVVFTVVAEKLYELGSLAKIKVSFADLLFECLYFANVYDGYLHQYLSRCSDRAFTLDVEVKRLRKLGQYVHNSMIITIFLVENSRYALPPLVLLETLNSPEDYRVAFKRYPFLKYGKSK